MAIERGFKGPEGFILQGRTIAIIEASASAPVSLTARLSAIDAPVIIDITPTVNCFICITPASGTPIVTVTRGYFMLANAAYRFPVTIGALITAISAVGAGAGTIYVHPVS